jgi:hypothetical protein
MIKRIEMRLDGGSAPRGEITVKDLNGIAAALQELVTRLGRESTNAAGPGRSKQFVEEFAQLRLGSIEAGSTVLQFSKGPTEKLDLDLAGLADADDRLWEILGAIGEDRRPDWTTELIADTVGRLVGALRSAARTTTFATAGRASIAITSTMIHPETWVANHVTDERMTAAGRLEKVDLRSHEFRLRDDVGHTVDLRQVVDDAGVAQLVGRWVAAEGTGVLNEFGRLIALGEAIVSSVVDPAEQFVATKVVSREEILASAPGPDPDGGIELTDEEFEEFMQALHS